MSNDLISRSALLEELKEKVYPEKFGERSNTLDVIYAVLQLIEEQPPAYDIDKVVEQLENVLQDLNVIEVISNIDFDSTIQNSLDNFLCAIKNEVLNIVKKRQVE